MRWRRKTAPCLVLELRVWSRPSLVARESLAPPPLWCWHHPAAAHDWTRFPRGVRPSDSYTKVRNFEKNVGVLGKTSCNIIGGFLGRGG